MEVIKGAASLFADSRIKAIIIELNGLGARYGYRDETIHQKLLEFAFLPYQYDPFTRKLNSLNGWGTDNTIYIRDISFVEDRLSHSRRYKVLNHSI